MITDRHRSKTKLKRRGLMCKKQNYLGTKMLAVMTRLSGMASIVLFFLLHGSASAQACYESMISNPTPFMGKNDEIFQLSDGSIWQVKYEYEYLYEYSPSVIICPDKGVLIINKKSLNVIALRSVDAPRGVRSPANAVTVVYRVAGCDYFIADGPKGLYVLEWYGGYDPVEGDTLAGYDGGYGMKKVTYLQNGREGRLWAEDYLLSADRAAEIVSEKCD
ncbi:hypothetical protein [Blastomonas sp. AAP25]|uniref:hypothetical protein n=1 Tax=Blastomonas sp. AAP25 TaxID=1523416 RepID=UPI0012E139D7|nr:hypothetical protein [Blastomonas sp. AAP25]